MGIRADQLDVVVEIRTAWNPDTADDDRERFWNNDPDWDNDDRKGILSVGVINHKAHRKFGVCHLGTCLLKMTNVALTWLKSNADGIRNNIDLIGKWVCVYAGTGYNGTPGGSETMFPYFVGKVRSISAGTDATVTLNCEDVTREILERTVQFREYNVAGWNIYDAPYSVLVQHDTSEWTDEGYPSPRYAVNPRQEESLSLVPFEDTPRVRMPGGFYWPVAPEKTKTGWIADDDLGGAGDPNEFAIVERSWISPVENGDTDRTGEGGSPRYNHLDRPIVNTRTVSMNDITAEPRRWYLEYGPPMSGQSYASGQSTIGTFKTWQAGDPAGTTHYMNFRKTDGFDQAGGSGSGEVGWLKFVYSGSDCFQLGSGYIDGNHGWDSSTYTETAHGFNIDGDGALDSGELVEWDDFEPGDRWCVWEHGITAHPVSHDSGVSYIESDEDIGDAFPLQIIYRILKYQMNLMTGIRRPLLTWGLDGVAETGGNSKYAVNKDSFDATLQDIVDYCGASPQDYLKKMVTVGNYPTGTKWIDIIQDCLRACLCTLYVDGSGSFNAISLGGIEDASGVSSDDYIIGDLEHDDFNLISAQHHESREKLINHVTINHNQLYWGVARDDGNVYEDATSISGHSLLPAKLKIGWRIPDALADDIISEWYLSRYADARHKISMVCTLSGALNTAPGDPVVLSGESLIDDSVQGNGSSLRCYERSLDPLGNQIKLLCYQDDTGLDFA